MDFTLFTIGFEESNSFYDYGIYFKYEKNRDIVQYKIAFSKDEFAIGKKLNGGGFFTGVEYDYKLQYFYDIKNIWHSSAVLPIDTLNYHKNKFSVLPLMNFAIGFNL